MTALDLHLYLGSIDKKLIHYRAEAIIHPDGDAQRHLKLSIVITINKYMNSQQQVMAELFDSMKGRDWPHATSFDLFSPPRTFERDDEDHDCTMKLKGYCNGCTAIAEALQN